MVTAAQMREIDRVTIVERGIPGIELMERAGLTISQACADLLQQPGPVLVLCGKGHNGGDGFVAARYLAQSGYETYVLPVLGIEGLSGDAKTAFERLPSSVSRLVLPDESAFQELVQGADGIIDAMLGTGFSGSPRSPLDWIIRTLNGSSTPVVSADIPTGLNSDTGEADLAVKAAITVTIGLPKIGMLSVSGVEHSGHVRVEPIQFPPDMLAEAGHKRRTITLTEAAALLPRRPPDGHKGSFGTASLFAGSRTMPGAAILAATGALRSGAGLVRAVTPSVNRGVLASSLPECLHELHGAEDVLEPLGETALKRLEANSDALLAGPGCTTAAAFGQLVEQLMSDTTGPLVLDADALNILAKRKDVAGKLTPRVIVTPHPGEMARLSGEPVQTGFPDRWNWAARTSGRLNCYVLLKGFGSLVATPEGRVTHIPTGNTALARGGSGDVLAGMICGLLAQGLPPEESAILGAFVCGLAADIAIRKASGRGLTTSEIARHIPPAWSEIEQSR